MPLALDTRSERLMRSVHHLPNDEAWAIVGDTIASWGIDPHKQSFFRQFLWERRRELNKLQVWLAVKRRRWYVVWDDGAQEFVTEHLSRHQATIAFDFHRNTGSCVVQMRDPSYRILKNLRQGE